MKNYQSSSYSAPKCAVIAAYFQTPVLAGSFGNEDLAEEFDINNL